MNWEAIGAVGELGGFIAVVASLVYVAVQVKQNTRELRSAGADSVVESIRDWHKILFQTAGTFEVFWSGLQDQESLDPKDRAKFMMIAFSFFKTVENLHFKYESGDLDEAVWRAWSVMLHSFIEHPGFQAYWRVRRSAFTPVFQSWVESSMDSEELVSLAATWDPARSPSTGDDSD